MLPAEVHRRIYLVLITLLGGCMVTSTWASNLVWVLLGANWVLEGRWREKWRMACESRLLQAFVVFYLLMLVGMLWTEHVDNGFAMLQVRLPLLVVPLVVLTSRPVTGRVRRWILSIYAATVLVVSVIGMVRLYTIPDLPYREAVPYISHIRFALNCCMVICLLGGEAARRWTQAWPRRWPVAVCAGLMVYMLFFLLKIHSYTALAVLAVVSLATLLAYYRRWPLLAAWLLMAGTLTFLVVREAKAYYRLVPQAEEPLLAYTAGGRPYTHLQDGILESGNYINNYICTDELRREWNRRSAVPYDSVIGDGWTVEPVLIRYLNALGLNKDSVGVHALSAEQVAEVERGVANPAYTSGNPIRKMVYVMLFEREFYLHTHAVKGFTMLQRFELWKATAHVVSAHRWTGVGTGDVDAEVDAELRAMDSELAGTGKRPHNQYLSLLAAYGVVGLVLLAVLFLRPLAGGQRRGNFRFTPLMTAWLLTIVISFLTEDTLDTLAGILFCTYFLAFRPAGKARPTD